MAPGPKDPHPEPRGDGADADAAAFAQAMRDARPLSGPRRVSPLTHAARGPAAARSARATAADARAKARIAVDDDRDGAGADLAAIDCEGEGETWCARADGVDRRVLRKLRGGDPGPEARIDLHGHTRARAENALATFLASARADGRRCLLVIHGRGLHSGDEGPTLRDLVRGRLTRGPIAAGVLACVSAPPSLGGSGATLVWLRR